MQGPGFHPQHTHTLQISKTHKQKALETRGTTLKLLQMAIQELEAKAWFKTSREARRKRSGEREGVSCSSEHNSLLTHRNLTEEMDSSLEQSTYAQAHDVLHIIIGDCFP